MKVLMKTLDLKRIRVQLSKKSSDLKRDKETSGKGTSKGNTGGLSRRPCSQRDYKFCNHQDEEDNARKPLLREYIRSGLTNDAMI